MAIQLKPFSLIRRHSDRSGALLSTVRLVRAQVPPDEHIEVRVGAGFRNLSQLVWTLRQIAMELESGNGFAPDMEEMLS